MDRKTNFTERVEGTVVVLSLVVWYKRVRTLSTEVARALLAFTAERNSEVPGWLRSRISSRSLGRGKMGFLCCSLGESSGGSEDFNGICRVCGGGGSRLGFGFGVRVATGA